MQKVKAFLSFWYDFVVGDDWRIALVVIIALAVTYGLSRAAVAGWWVLPAAILLILPYSLWRAARRRG